MRNSQINTQVLDKREYVLMRNRREELELIPTVYITEYYSKKDDVSTLTLEIPSKVRRGELEVDYPLYDHFQPRRHITVKLNDEVIERFTVESINIEDSNNFKIKRITAYGYDNILKTKSCLINEGLTRQLYLTEDEEVHVGEGILNIFEEQTGWKVNHIDELAMKEQVTENVTVTKELMGAKTYEKVEDNMVLFEKDFTVPSEENFPLNFDIAWLDLVVTTTDGFKYESGSIIHTFTDYPTGVTKIKATFTSDSTQRYGITYEITLDNGETSKVTHAFTNCRKLKLETKGINLTYQTSQEEEKMATKYRYLEHSQSYWYQYLKTTVQEAFGVYIRFNTHNKTIDVFNEEQFGQWKGFHLDFDNLLSKINKQPNMSELCTRLWIQSNSVDITEVNPLGTSYLEDYSYFEQSGTMSESLSSALKRYYAHVEVKQVEWLEISKLKSSNDQWLTKRNSELTSLNEQVKAKQAILTAYLKDKDNEEGQKRVAQELKELEEQVSQKLSQIETLKAQSDEYLSQMQLIGKQMAKETSEDSRGKIFTNVDLEELDDITIEQTYTDDYYTKAKGLFEYGKTLMKDKATLRYTFTLEHKDLAQNIKHPLGWEWFIELGAKVEIADKDIANKDGFITIYAYKYSPKTQQMTSVEFDNNSAVIKAVSGIASFSKIAHNTANMTDFWKHTWVEADKATAIVSDIRKNGLDLAANMVRGGNTVNKISMTESGIFVIDAENEDNQVYIGASLIAITDDRWITSKTAIDKNGLISDTLVGKLILSEKLFISNEDGSFEILPNGLTIRDELGKEQVSLGIDDKKNPFLHLGIKDESKNHLIFNSDGTLDIKATSIKLMTGDVVSKEEMEEIANNVANKLDLAIRNYALDTVMQKTLTGNGNNEQVISLYELSQDGTTFMDKEVTLTFKYTTTLESQGSFFVRTGSNHYQALTDVIVIGSETRQGKVAKTVTITKEVGQSFSDLELVARNFTGEITISMLKFSLGNKATDWTPAPEDSDASYSVVLTNESQVIPTTTSLKPLSNSQYTTQVIVYQGTKQQTNFKIKPLVAKDGITPSINGDTITFSVNKNTILSANQGQFEIEIEIDNMKFKKMWAWATASQGQDGTVGESAKQVVVTGEQVFKYQNNFTGNPSNLTIRLTATLFHTTGCQWSYRVGSGNPVNISGATNTTLDIQHNASYWGNHKQLVFRCTSNDAIFDEMTVVKVSDGMNGESSYTVFLTNENHSFPCESNGNIPVALETTTNVVVFKGSEKITPTIGNILKPDGLDVRVGITNNNEVPLTIIALSGNQLGLGGNIAIPILADGQEFEKSFTYSKAKSGEKGEDGSNAHYITITGEQFFKYGNEGFTGTPSPSQIVLTAQRTNLTGRGEWQYLDGAVWRALNVNTDTLTVTPTTGGLAHNSTCSFRFIVDGNYDIMTIAKLSDGANGQDGINGSNAYFYIRYSANADGSNMTSTPQTNTKYMGTCSSTSATAPTNASAYSWSLIKGEDGEQGIKGEDGANGESSYLHVKYSNDGRTFTPNNGEDLGSWIGTYVDNNPMDSSVFSDYNWSKFVGEDGQDGQDGASAKFVIMNGEQAFKYTNNFTGNPTPTSITLATTVYNVNNPTYKWSFKRAGETTWNTISGATSGNYSLTHNNSTIFNSNNVKSVTLRCTVNNDIFDEMTIVKVSDGANGTNGKDGINGIDGQDGVSTYFYVRYSANANGSNMTNTPNANSLYMGTCSTTSQVAPTNPTDYQWTLIKGADGKDGIAGANGSDGRTSYLHIKYSNDGQTFTPNNGEDVGLYIGTYVDFVQADSNNFNDYTWKKFVGEDGEDGLDAYTVILTNESHAFPCASNGNVTNAISINTTAIAYKGATSVTPTIGTLPSVNGLTLSKNGAVVTIQANTGTSLADSGTANIPVVVDGKTFTKVFSWTKAKSGVDGVNGYTILLDNENFTFQASSTGNITSQIQTTTTATVYQGTVQKTPTIGNLPTVNGLTLTKNGATVTIVAKTGTALAEQGEFTIPIIVDNQTFTRKFTWTKARSGAEAQHVVVNGEQVFKYTDNFSGAPTPSQITLTADKINISTNGKWQYKNANGSWTDWTVNNAVVTATTLTVSPNSHLLNSAKQMSVRYIVGTLYDEITIVKVSDGTNGSTGIGIKTIQEQYYLSTSQTTLIDGSWQTTAPKWETGKFIWTKTVFTYTNDMMEETTPICVTGRDGSDGLNGGVSVSNVDVFYYQSNSATSLTGGNWSTEAPTWVNGKYIWSKTITYLDNGKTIESDAICITGQKGQDGTNGKGIKTITNYYLASSSSTGVTTSTSGWTTEVQSMTSTKKYLWNYEKVTYTDDSITNTTPAIIGVFGTDGVNGQDGVGIKSIREYYLATNSASGVTSATSGWTETVQTPTKDKKYLWNYEVIVYTNNTTYTGTPRIIGNFAQDGMNGSNGANGADAYTVILSNENHTFPCESNGNIPTAINATTNIIAYKGATSVTPTIGNLPSVNGLTLSKSGTTVTIQANTGTALASSGSLTIPVTVDGKNFNKVFSWSKAFKGANGASGSNAKSADIVSTSQVFKSTDGGVTFTPDTITLTPILQNVSFSKWQYSTNGGSSWSNVSNGQNGLTVSGNNLVISKSSSLYTTSITSVSFKLITNDSNIYDTMTIVKLYDVKDMEIGGRNLILDSGKKRGGSTRASEYNINFFKNSKVIVTNPSDSFYSDYPNPPVGGVFNNIKRPINKLNKGNLDAPAITQSALTLIKLYESTGDEECYNRAKLIADYIVSRIYVGSYYGKPMPLMTSRASYKNGAWVNSVGEMTIRNTYQAMYALLRFYQVSNEEIYLTKATDLMKSCGSIYNNINKRVDEGALEEYMRGAVYEYAYDTDGKVTWSWSLVSALSADFLGEAILLYIDIVGNDTMLDNEGKSFKPKDILTGFAQYVKNSINAGVFEMSNGTGLPYYFMRNQVGTNWDWVDGTGYGDVWFANDSVLWVIKGLAYIAKKELDNELLEIATRYRNTFFNLKVENQNRELLWHDRYTFNGHALDDDTSVSISATALMYDIDTILGIGRKERNNVQYETTLKNYQIKDQDLNISGSYGWNAMESDSSIEVKATSEIWLSEYYDAIVEQLTGDSDVYNLSEKMVGGKQYTISLTPASPSASSYIEINSSRVKLEYKEKTGRACATFVADGQMNLATKIKIMSVGMTYPKLEKGSVATDWSPAPEDGIDYTDKLIDDLRKLDLKQITDQNQESSNMIANILNDSLIMPHEKTSLKFEFERIKILKENAINYYNTVNDTSFQQLRNAMNTAYTNVENMINPILANMTQTSNASNSAVHTTFQTFYTAYETLMTALQQSVIILATKHSTKLEQLDKEITMTASKAEIMQDKVNQFDAHMRFSADGFVEIFATENGQKGRFSTQITNKKLSFKDNDVEVAYVSNQELNINKAVINDTMKIGNFAIKPSGSSTGGIVFAYETGGANTDSEVRVTGISIDIDSATLEVGATKQVNANVVPTNASNKNIIWSSSSTGVASVSASGLITAKSNGSCTITAKTSDGGFTKAISVTVKQTQTEAPNPTPPSPTIPVTGIEVDGWDVTLKVGGSKQLNAYVVPRDATNQLIHWYSNNTSVATVTSSGLVQAVGEGYALVTATTDDGGIPYNVHVNVEANSSGGTTPNPPMEDNTIANGSETPIYQQYSTSHEAKPNNPNPASGAYNWNDAPRINPDGAFPQSSWNAIGHWMTSYLVKGASYYDNVAVLLQNPKMWIWNTATKSWDVLSDDFEWGTWYLEDFWNDGNGNIANTTLWQTGESANHSKWVKIKQTSETTGRCFHPWGYQKNWRNNSNWSNNGQPYIITKVDFKLVKWDSNGVDNLDRARIVVDSGADWWRNVGDTWQSDWSTSRDMAVGKYILATRDLKRAYCTNLPQNWSYGFPTVNDNPNIGEDAPSGGGSTVTTEIQVENTTVQKGRKLIITFSSVGLITSGGGCCLFDSNNTPICTGYFESNSKAILDTETLGASSYSVYLSASQWDENNWNNKPISPRSNVFILSVTESSGGNNTPPSGSSPSLSPSSATLNRNQSQTFTIVGTTSTIARGEFAKSYCSIDGETDNTITITGRVSGSDVLIVTLSDGTQLQAQITIN